MPVGGTDPRAVDVRVISATNRDLEDAVRSGGFREDFFYRLNVFAIVVPPLRERSEDVLPIARRLLASRGLPDEKLSPGAGDRLLAHAWPGNVRELENTLERALILAGDGEIREEHLAAGRPARAAPASELLGRRLRPRGLRARPGLRGSPAGWREQDARREAPRQRRLY